MIAKLISSLLKFIKGLFFPPVADTFEFPLWFGR